MVTVPSGAMRTQALISRAVAALASGMSRRPSAPSAMAKPSAPVLFRNWRRSMSRLLGRALDGGDDAVVGAAAADHRLTAQDAGPSSRAVWVRIPLGAC